MVRDWLLLAPVPIWISLLVDLTLDVDLVGNQIREGALVVYGLGCFIASYDRLRVDAWEHGKYPAAAAVARGLRWLIIIVAVSSTAIFFTSQALMPQESEPSSVHNIALMLTATGWAVAGIAVATLAAAVIRISIEDR